MVGKWSGEIPRGKRELRAAANDSKYKLVFARGGLELVRNTAVQGITEQRHRITATQNHPEPGGEAGGRG